MARYIAPWRREWRCEPEPTVRFETGPGKQAQVDWGTTWTYLGEQRTRIHIFDPASASRAIPAAPTALRRTESEKRKSNSGRRRPALPGHFLKQPDPSPKSSYTKNRIPPTPSLSLSDDLFLRDSAHRPLDFFPQCVAVALEEGSRLLIILSLHSLLANLHPGSCGEPPHSL